MLFLLWLADAEPHFGDEDQEAGEDKEAEHKTNKDVAYYMSLAFEGRFIQEREDKAETVQYYEDKGSQDVEEAIQLRKEGLPLHQERQKERSSNNHQAALEPPWEEGCEDNSDEEVAVEKEDRVVEATHVVLNVVQVFVDFSEFLFVEGITQSGRGGAENVKEQKGEHQESEEDGEREKRGEGVRSGFKGDLK